MPASTLAELPGPVALVCHDAGAANLLLAWAAAEPSAELLPVMVGPAAALWTEQFPGRPSLPLADAMNRAGALVSGSGWASDLEHRARSTARVQGLPSVAVIDHWVNYRDRFTRDGETVLPDILWVSDAFARALAEQAFPAVPVVEKDNLYLASQVARIAPSSGDAGDSLLYALEPARDDWGQGEPGEFQGLDYLLANLAQLGLLSSVPIRLRPHPSEAKGKYAAWVEDQDGFDIAFDEHDSLAGAIGAATWVAGLNTAALPIALAAGRRAVSTLPPWAPPCVLPHDGIVHLKALAEPS